MRKRALFCSDFLLTNAPSLIIVDETADAAPCGRGVPIQQKRRAGPAAVPKMMKKRSTHSWLTERAPHRLQGRFSGGMWNVASESDRPEQGNGMQREILPRMRNGRAGVVSLG